MSLHLKNGSQHQPWRAAQTQTVFLTFTFFSLILSGIAYVYAVSRYTLAKTFLFYLNLIPFMMRAFPLFNFPQHPPLCGLWSLHRILVRVYVRAHGRRFSLQRFLHVSTARCHRSYHRDLASSTLQRS